jgi:tetratricopeptide (TPR) repeat protein
MRFHFAVMTALLSIFAPALLAQVPDDRYLQVYSLIEEGDKLNGSGQARSAMTKYLEAQVAIKDLQQAYPDWNAKLVSYRLEYISSRLEPLTHKVSIASTSSVTGGSAEVGAVHSITNQLKSMQEEIARLAAQNALLEAKLREALKVQPAGGDPRELAKADERIKALQKERDLLAVSLEQAGAKSTALGAGLKKETALESKQNLVTQGAVVSVLQKQNEELQKRIADLSLKLQEPAPRVQTSGETLSLRQTVAELEARNRVMKEEQSTMENRLMDFVRRHGSSTSAKEKELENQLAAARAAATAAERERDELIQKLSGVTKELNQRDTKAPVAGTRELEQQLEGIRAKLQIFEARSVPYSAEELALFKQAPIKVASEQTNAPVVKKKSHQIPPGAGPLVAEAQRAIDTGRLAEAEKKYQEVLRQDENNVHILANLAAVQMDQEKASEAETTLRKALELDSQDPVSLYLMGGLKLRAEKYDEALESLSLSAKLAPEMAQTQYYLGKALIQKGDRAPAETALRKAVQLKPGWGEAHYLLAVLYATQQPNFKELSQYHYKKAIAGGAPRNVELEQWMEKPPSTVKR